MKRFITILFLLIPSVSWSQTIYMRPQEALSLQFQTSQEVIQEEKRIKIAQDSILKKRLGYIVAKKDWTFYIAKSGKRVDGYAFIDNEVGKTEPITFMTFMTPKGEVKAVEILVYREAIGSEVHSKKFLKQFYGKGVGEPVRLGQDIKSITGATMSARAVSRGVKRALVLWEVFYGKTK